MADFERVDIGSAPNAKDGDTARAAFTKINNNFEVLFETREGTVSEVNRDFTAESNNTYLVNTTSTRVTAKLPLIPVVGTIIRFVDSSGKWGLNPFIVDPNGSRIQGNVVPALQYDTNFAFVDFFYTGNVSGWIIR